MVDCTRTYKIQSKEFFSSPKEQKAEYAIHSDKAGGINRGWVQMAGEALDPESGKVDHPSPYTHTS
jgi:isopenicillin N synthase-like dioxygenase